MKKAGAFFLAAAAVAAAIFLIPVQEKEKFGQGQIHGEAHFGGEERILTDEEAALAEGCRQDLEELSKSKDNRNNIDLCWNIVSRLFQGQESIYISAQLLEEYAERTRGLTSESQVKLYGNIGQLYFLSGSYASALYYYWRGIYKLETEPWIPDNEFYQAKILSAVGDTSYALEQYETAIKQYSQSLEMFEASGRRDSAAENSLCLINKSASHIEMGQLSEAASCLKRLEELLEILPAGQRDDIEILKKNQLAQLAARQNDLDTAEKELREAYQLLESDTEEYSLGKEIYLDNTRAQLYQRGEQYEEALKLYQKTAEASEKQGLGLEAEIYYDMSKICMELGKQEQYVQYIELYAETLKKKNQALSEEYVDYSRGLYECSRLKRERYLGRMAAAAGGTMAVILFSGFTWFLIKWRKKSVLDQMTRLYTRTYLDEYMKRNKKKLLNHPLSVIMLDIDYFKQYNDCYGHLKGDAGIKTIAEILIKAAGKNGRAVRYGGEEMLVLLPNSDKAYAEKTAEWIQAAVKEEEIPHCRSEAAKYLTVSMGIYTKEYQGEDIFELIGKADEALYQAKEAGRNRYCVRQQDFCQSPEI